MNDLKVSVIVPIYKVEKYIHQCVDSILNQTYNNIEVILVDDGSPDDCPQICNSYMSQDSRVMVIHKKNGGQSSARKAGMEWVTGQYVMFVDGDDWIELNTIEVCLEEIEKDSDIECILFSYLKVTQGVSIPIHIMDGTAHLIGKEAEEKIYRRLFGLATYELKHPERMENMTSCCMKLYKTECARKGRYFDIDEIGSCEDGLFNIYALHKCRNMVYLDEHLYHYRKLKTSTTNSFRPRLIEQWGNLFSIMKSVIDEKQLGKEYDEALINRIALSITAIGLNELNNISNGVVQHIQQIRGYLKSDMYRHAVRKMNTKHMPLMWKVLMIACKFKNAFVVYMILCMINILRNRQIKGE